MFKQDSEFESFGHLTFSLLRVSFEVQLVYFEKVFDRLHVSHQAPCKVNT